MARDASPPPLPTRTRELELKAEGYSAVAGVDEVGVGPLAGPVIAAAVVLSADFDVPGVRDSKLIDPDERGSLEKEILTRAACAFGMASVREIDAINIYEATALAMKRAVESLSLRPDYLLIDARRIDLEIPQEGPVRGDQIHTCIAAASIVAKELRDRHMTELDVLYPGYGLAEHKGYSTSRHFEAIRKLGLSPVHRGSWLAVRELAGLLSPEYYELADAIRTCEKRQVKRLDRKLDGVREGFDEGEHDRLRALLRRQVDLLAEAQRRARNAKRRSKRKGLILDDSGGLEGDTAGLDDSVWTPGSEPVTGTPRGMSRQ
jgi:ribonuclease HII